MNGKYFFNTFEKKYQQTIILCMYIECGSIGMC